MPQHPSPHKPLHVPYSNNRAESGLPRLAECQGFAPKSNDDIKWVSVKNLKMRDLRKNRPVHSNAGPVSTHPVISPPNFLTPNPPPVEMGLLLLRTKNRDICSNQKTETGACMDTAQWCRPSSEVAISIDERMLDWDTDGGGKGTRTLQRGRN